MAQRVTHPVMERPAPGSHLGRARLLLGAVAVAAGLFVGLHWLGLPGAQLSLDRNRHRTDSVAALEQTGHAKASRPTTASARGRNTRTATRSSSVNKAQPRRGSAPSRKAGNPISSQPRKPEPGTPPAANDTTVGESSPEQDPTALPPPPPPPAGPLPIELPKTPQLPQLPQVPQVPQVPQLPQVPPVPSLPDLPKPKVPSVPTPQLPTLP